MAFYDLFLDLCNQKGVKPSHVAEACNFNRSNITNWKNGGYTPRGSALQKIADYFGVTADFLLGAETEKAPTADGERNSDNALDKVKIALFGGDVDVTDEMWDEALFAAQLIKERHKRKKE